MSCSPSCHFLTCSSLQEAHTRRQPASAMALVIACYVHILPTAPTAKAVQFTAIAKSSKKGSFGLPFSHVPITML